MNRKDARVKKIINKYNPSRETTYINQAKLSLFFGYGPFWKRKIRKAMEKIPYRSNGYSDELTFYIFGMKRLRCKRQRAYWSLCDTGFTRNIIHGLLCSNVPSEAEEEQSITNHRVEEINRHIYWLLKSFYGTRWTNLHIQKIAPGASAFVDTTTILFDNCLDLLDELLVEATEDIAKKSSYATQIARHTNLIHGGACIVEGDIFTFEDINKIREARTMVLNAMSRSKNSHYYAA